MLTLPTEDGALVAALSRCLAESRAGLLFPERDEDPDALAAALDAASVHAGTPIKQAWIDGGRRTIAWLRADDLRLALDPDLAILGVVV